MCVRRTCRGEATYCDGNNVLLSCACQLVVLIVLSVEVFACMGEASSGGSSLSKGHI